MPMPVRDLTEEEKRAAAGVPEPIVVPPGVAVASPAPAPVDGTTGARQPFVQSYEKTQQDLQRMEEGSHGFLTPDELQEAKNAVLLGIRGGGDVPKTPEEKAAYAKLESTKPNW